jgi:hypothetical protein
VKNILKKPLILVLSVLLIFSLSTPAFAVTTANDYDSSWAKETIQQAIASGIAQGYPDGTFKPDNPITRAEFFEWVNNVYSLTRESTKTYADVPSTAWFAPVIAKATAAEYVFGYPDGTINPNGNITRQEAAVIINRLNSIGTAANTLPFSDATSIAVWSKPAVMNVAAAAIMVGYPNGSFQPEAPITRAEALVTITRAFSMRTMNIAVYYIKSTADDMVLVREVHTVAKSLGIARAALNELISGTPLTEGAMRVLPADTRILGLTIENNLATVNFSQEVLNANVGSTGEALGIASIVNTLTEFPTIERVQFFVEGSAANGMGWWGHVGLSEQPFTRNLTSVYAPAIWVTSPTPGQTITSPLHIQGMAQVFEAMVSYRLKDANGNILVQSQTMSSDGAPAHGTFDVYLPYPSTTSGYGTLEVYEVSMKDGSDRNVVVIPIEFVTP